MTSSTHKSSNRSELIRSLNIVWQTNHMRSARLDFWGAVALVCAMGMLAKLAQSLLTN